MSNSKTTLTTPLYLLLLLLLLVLTPITTSIITTSNDNLIISTLSAFPDLSSFASLLSSSFVSNDLSSRTSITLLAVPNPLLSLSSPPSPDSLRYHVILQYLTTIDLHALPPSGKLFTTLFQTTGRASGSYGSVNVTFDDATKEVAFRSPFSTATLLSEAKLLPYNLSIMTVDSVLVPVTSTDLTASQTRPPMGMNITNALLKEGHSFHVAAAMISASGVGEEFEGDEGGAGLTLFVPTDEAFANLPASVRFQSLPAGKKAEVLKFHVLRSYYPLGSLEGIVNPVQPTLATEETGAGRFTLNISKINGCVAINTGIDEAMVTQTVFDQNPVAIFGVSKVLLPKEIFGDDNSNSNSNNNNNQVDVGSEAPDSNSPVLGFYGPTGSREEIRSSVAAAQRRGVYMWCMSIALFFVLV